MEYNFPELNKCVNLTIGDLRNFFQFNRETYNIVFTHRRTIDLIPLKVNIVKEICKMTEDYFIMINIKNSSPSHPRFWEYEYRKNGFTLLKHFYPENSYCKELVGDDRKFMFQVYKRDKK